MDPIKWDLMEQFRNQQRTREQKINELRQKAQEAQQRMNQVSQRMQQFRFRQNQNDGDEERRQAESELNAAREDYQMAMREMQSPFGDEEVTVEKLAKDWNDNMLPKIKEQHIKPIADKMKKARYVYLKSLKDYVDVLNTYGDDVNQASNLGFGRMMQANGQRPLNFQAPDFNELPLIRQEHLNQVMQQHRLPDDITRQ